MNNLPAGFETSREISESERWDSNPPKFLSYSEKYDYQLRCHLYQARSLIGSDQSGLSDPFCRVVFEGHSATTEVISQTLSPCWDQIILFDHVTIFGNAKDLSVNPPEIVVQIFDQDQVGKDEFLGQAVVPCVVKLLAEPYQAPKFPPQLQWYPIFRGSERGGELLAVFELLQASF